jgi:hypothetical protein
MSSRKQPAANPANAQNPSSPTTQGQPATRYDAAKHGIFAHTQIMFDESAEDLAALAAEYHEQYNPADSTKRFLVDTLIYNEWRLRRMRRVDAELWQSASNAFLAKNAEAPACSSGDSFATAAPTFERLQRTVNACERIYHRALKELQHQKSPKAEPAPPVAEPAVEPSEASQPEQSKPTSANLGSFAQNPQTPSPAAPQPPVFRPDVTPVADPETQPSASDRDSKLRETA